MSLIAVFTFVLVALLLITGFLDRRVIMAGEEKLSLECDLVRLFCSGDIKLTIV